MQAFFAALVSATAMVAFAASAEATHTSALERRMGRLATMISKSIGSAACTSDTQCRAIGIGVKPCGGIVRYVPYSTAVTNPTRLTALVRQYNATQARLNEELGLVSDCLLVLPPEEVVCRNSRCVIP